VPTGTTGVVVLPPVQTPLVQVFPPVHDDVVQVQTDFAVSQVGVSPVHTVAAFAAVHATGTGCVCGVTQDLQSDDGAWPAGQVRVQVVPEVVVVVGFAAHPVPSLLQMRHFLQASGGLLDCAVVRQVPNPVISSLHTGASVGQPFAPVELTR